MLMVLNQELKKGSLVGTSKNTSSESSLKALKLLLRYEHENNVPILKLRSSEAKNSEALSVN